MIYDKYFVVLTSPYLFLNPSSYLNCQGSFVQSHRRAHSHFTRRHFYLYSYCFSLVQYIRKKNFSGGRPVYLSRKRIFLGIKLRPIDSSQQNTPPSYFQENCYSHFRETKGQNERNREARLTRVIFHQQTNFNPLSSIRSNH